MAARTDINSRGVDTARDIGEKTRHGAQTLSAQAQKSSQQVSRQTQSGLQKVQIAITVGSALLQSLLHSQERTARKSRRGATRQARHFRNAVQDTFQPTWSKTQDVIGEGLETTEVTLQKRVKRARKNLRKTQKNLKHLQKAAQENLESGWSAARDKWEEGSQQVSRNLTKVGSNAQGASKTIQKRYRHSQRKRARARALFRWGLVIGFVLALLYTPITGAEIRHRIILFWKKGWIVDSPFITGGEAMVTYVSKMFASTSEAEKYLSTYQTLIEGAGGMIRIEAWERKDIDRTTLTKETIDKGETTAEVTQEVETTMQRGPVLYVTLPEKITLSTLLAGSEALAFKVTA